MSATDPTDPPVGSTEFTHTYDQSYQVRNVGGSADQVYLQTWIETYRKKTGKEAKHCKVNIGQQARSDHTKHDDTIVGAHVKYVLQDGSGLEYIVPMCRHHNGITNTGARFELRLGTILMRADQHEIDIHPDVAPKKKEKSTSK